MSAQITIQWSNGATTEHDIADLDAALIERLIVRLNENAKHD